MAALRELRKQAFLTQQELAARASLSPWTIHRLEIGITKPRAKTVRELAKALRVKPGQIEFGL